MEELRDTTCVLCTLNEQDNIEPCVRSIRDTGASRIIVVDAQSEDDTVELARALGAEVHVVERRGLAYQRQYGVDLVETDLVLMADADNRFPPDCLTKLVRFLVDSDYAGVAPQKLNQGAHDYWTRVWEWTNTSSLYTPGPKLVIGTPALYRTKILKEVRYDPYMTGGADDTDLCYRLSKSGYTVAAAPVECFEVMRSSFRGFAKKVIWYGKSDAEFFMRHPERRLSIAIHPIKNHLIKGSWRAIRAARPQFVPYYLTYGSLRSYGLVKSLVGKAFSKQNAIERT